MSINNAEHGQPKKRAPEMLVVDGLNFVTSFTLWFAAASTSSFADYSSASVKDFNFATSFFDVFIIGCTRSLILFILFLNVTKFEKPVWQILGLFLPLLSFIFLVVKLGYTLSEGFSSVLGGAIFGGFILGCEVLFTVIQIYQAATIRAYLNRLQYAPLQQEKDEEKALQSRLDEAAGKTNVGIGRLLSLVKPEVKILTFGMIALFINSFTQAALPLIVGILVDALVEGEDDCPLPSGLPTITPKAFVVLPSVNPFALEERTPEEKLNASITLLMIFFAIASIFGFIRAWLFTLAGHRVVAKLRKDLFTAITNQEIGFFDRTRTGELTSRLTSDTQIIQNAVTTNISMLVRYLVQIIISVVILFILSWQLTLVMFSVVPVIAVGAVVYGRFIQKLQKQFQDELANATTVAEEVISNVRTVRAFSKEQRSQGLYGDAVHKAYEIGSRISFGYGTFNGVLSFIPQGAIAFILWYGGTLVLNGQITTGLLTSFLLYTLSVAVSFAFLSGLFGDFMQAVGASSRIFQLIDRVPEIPVRGGDQIAPLKGHVEYQNVTFSYPSRNDTKVLMNVNLALEPGSVLALVGPSGGGKSTIVSLIERFYDVSEGKILIDGVDIRSLDPEWLRSNIALVSQEPVLFANTIRENICYGIERNASQKEVEDAAKAANAHSFISAFPESYDTQVGERGVRLSGGQKQRIAIARALLMDPRILLLDEATSALDAESEYLVQDAIEKAMKGRTVLIIAHRLSTVKNADLIAVLAGGSIVEKGSHQELLEMDGLYKKLVNRQMQTGLDNMDEVFADFAKEEKIKRRESSQLKENQTPDSLEGQ